MRKNFNEGQEIIFTDLNEITEKSERMIFDRVIFEMMQQRSDAVFQESFKVLKVNATSVLIKSGFGFQKVGTENRPLYLKADKTVFLDAPDSSNPRIDLICIRSAMEDSKTETRKYKDEFSDQVTTKNFAVERDYTIEGFIAKGDASPTPVKPNVPVGYIAIAEIRVDASLGIQAESNITDVREQLPMIAGGSVAHDIVVGKAGEIGVTHGDLKSACDSVKAGQKILVIADQIIDDTPIIAVDDVEVEFKKGVSVTKGTAEKGLLMNGKYGLIKNGRFFDFVAGIEVNGSGCVIERARFKNCTENVSDLDGGTDYNITTEV